MKHRVHRALISVYDKTGVAELAETLAGAGVELISSGGTARLLEERGIAVRKVSDYTGFPEMLDGRVKTLHPRIHGGILAMRGNPEHIADLERESIETIDLVVVNLYPFEKTAAIEGIAFGEVIEMIDVGGPTMVRAAAKNHADVAVVVSPEDYRAVIEQVRATGGIDQPTRRRLAARAFRHTAAYDAAICNWLDRAVLDGAGPDRPSPFPERLELNFIKSDELRYGENPHQAAAFYREAGAKGPSVARADKLQGKALSFNNILDFDAALAVALEFRDPACAIIKHGNPCGAALGAEASAAFRRALECDPVSAFGGVIAFNRTVDGPTAKLITEQFYEGVIAPAFDDDAREVLRKKKNLRLLAVGALANGRRAGYDLRRVAGGLLVQDWDVLDEDVREARVATRRAPSADEWQALAFGWVVCKHVKSNAIVYTRSDRTIGIGAGQMSRVDSARFGMLKAQVPLDGTAMASDAFFPFRDGVDVAAEAGITAIVQPGGSIRDDEVIAAADEHGMTMVLTGRRHFRH